MLFTVWVSLAVLVRFVIIVELQSVCLCPRCCLAGIASIYRRLCLCAGVGVGGTSSKHRSWGGWRSPVAGNGQLEALLLPVNTSFQHTESFSPLASEAPLRTCLLVALHNIHDGARNKLVHAHGAGLRHHSNLIIIVQEWSFHGSKTTTWKQHTQYIIALFG